MQTRPRIHLMEQRRNRALNTIHTWLLTAGSLALLAVTAWAFAGLPGILAAVVFGGISLAAMRRISPRMVLSMYKARPVTRAEFPTGVSIVEQLARRAELPAVPKLHVVPSKMMNAFAVGRRDDSAIVVTDALVRNLTTRELAGVLAHEMSHVAHEDLKVMALADIVSRYTSAMSTIGILSLFFNLGGLGIAVPWLAVLVLIAAPTVGGLLQLALSRTREFDADLGAAMLTGDPDGLASALRKLERAQGRLWESMMLPGGRVPNPSVLRTHPETEERVRRLMALKDPEVRAALEPLVEASPVRRVRGRSPVPSIPRRAGRRDRADIDWLAARLSAAVPPPLDGIDDDSPKGPLCPDEGKPRIRIGRGGVWW